MAKKRQMTIPEIREYCRKMGYIIRHMDSEQAILVSSKNFTRQVVEVVKSKEIKSNTRFNGTTKVVTDKVESKAVEQDVTDKTKSEKIKQNMDALGITEKAKSAVQPTDKQADAVETEEKQVADEKQSVKKKRGRPAKKATTNKTTSSSASKNESSKKKRGRPKGSTNKTTVKPKTDSSSK